MRTETRIVKCKDHKKHSIEASWNVEWRKGRRDQWKLYGSCDTPHEAEQLRQICRSEGGKYQVVYETRKGLRRYKVLHDYSRGGESFNIYYRLPLESWVFHHLKYDCSTAIEQCQELARRRGPKTTFHTGLMRWPYKVAHTIESCLLCIRYPFLYPRNRFTDRHYNNWWLDEAIKELFDNSHERTNPVDFHQGMTDDELYQMQHPKYKTTDKAKAVKCALLKAYRGILRLIHCVPTYTEMDAMDYGWRKAFGKEMLREVRNELKRSGKLRSYRIAQIKEKWGGLCWYDAGGTKELFDILRKYESKSYCTCISCGRPAKYRTVGYILPYCEKCMSREDITSGNYDLINRDGSVWKETDFDEFSKDLGLTENNKE